MSCLLKRWCGQQRQGLLATIESLGHLGLGDSTPYGSPCFAVVVPPFSRSLRECSRFGGSTLAHWQAAGCIAKNKSKTCRSVGKRSKPSGTRNGGVAIHAAPCSHPRLLLSRGSWRAKHRTATEMKGMSPFVGKERHDCTLVRLGEWCRSTPGAMRRLPWQRARVWRVTVLGAQAAEEHTCL